MPFVNYFLTTNQKSISAGARRFPALALPLTIAGRGATVAASGSASSCPTWPENGSRTNIRQPAKNLLLCGLSDSILMYTDSFPCMPENFPVSQQTKVYPTPHRKHWEPWSQWFVWKRCCQVGQEAPALMQKTAKNPPASHEANHMNHHVLPYIFKTHFGNTWDSTRDFQPHTSSPSAGKSPLSLRTPAKRSTSFETSADWPKLPTSRCKKNLGIGTCQNPTLGSKGFFSQ